MKTKITKALVIDEPWISRIINGEKDWEMRSFSTRIRGPIGLIRKGSLQVVGIANMSNVSGPYDNEQLITHTQHHTIPKEMFDEPTYKWRHAWELTDIQPLAKPVSYIHKNGAVIWVELDETAIENVARQLNGDIADAYLNEAEPVEIDATNIGIKPVEATIPKPFAAKQSSENSMGIEQFQSAHTKHADSILVPKAKDGSVFSRHTCNNKGVYTVGNKGDEKKFGSFHEALDYLKSMPAARWRRPNANGNFGIVTAVDWFALKN